MQFITIRFNSIHCVDDGSAADVQDLLKDEKSTSHFWLTVKLLGIIIGSLVVVIVLSGLKLHVARMNYLVLNHNTDTVKTLGKIGSLVVVVREACWS